MHAVPESTVGYLTTTWPLAPQHHCGGGTLQGMWAAGHDVAARYVVLLATFFSRSRSFSLYRSVVSAADAQSQRHDSATSRSCHGQIQVPGYVASGMEITG